MNHRPDEHLIHFHWALAIQRSRRQFTQRLITLPSALSDYLPPLPLIPCPQHLPEELIMHLSYDGQGYPSSPSTTRSHQVGQSECGLLKYRGVAYNRMVASAQLSSGNAMKLTYRGQSYTAHQPVAGSHPDAPSFNRYTPLTFLKMKF